MNVLDNPVTDHSFSLKCLPRSTARQRVDELYYDVKYAEGVTEDRDSFGNIVLNGRISKPHREFCLKVWGKVSTGYDIAEERDADPIKNGVFKFQTPMTKPGESLREYYERLSLEEFEDSLETADKIMAELFKTFTYSKGVTSVKTFAEEAMCRGEGVCQDYAHIMISLLRMKGIPARYTVGMFVGEGETHAWVEVLCNGSWYGYDPTNNKKVDEEYIKISSGRDASDCSVNKGIFIGIANQQQEVNLSVSQQ